MKKCAAILFAALLAGSLSAQHYVGVRGGYGNGMIRLFPPMETGAVWGCYNFGVAYKYYSGEKVLGGVEVNFQYIQKGYTQPPDYSRPDTVMAHRVNALELPIFWQPHLYVMGRDMRVFINLGVVFAHNLNATRETFSRRDGVITPRQTYEMRLVRDNSWAYGLCGGFGLNYITGRLELLAEARYNFGYSDLFKNNNRYATNMRLQRSPIDNIYFSVGAFWRLGKGGILSPPSKRAAVKLAQKEEAKKAAKAARAAEKGLPDIPSDTLDTLQSAPVPADSLIFPVPGTILPGTPSEKPQPDKNQNDGNDTPAESSATDTKRRR